ncbi:chemotaxis protein CheA [Natronorubrum sulfidifaciens]|nr:chemotaxis protein CheA [Natronorubrum sulfidifaciens]
MTDYLSDFVQESEDRITELNNALLTFEREPTNDEAMESIFRVAHTLKSNCGAMGLEAASDLAHAIEDLLDAVRADEIEVTPELMDAIFEGVDELETMIDEVAADGETETDPSATIETLRGQLDIQSEPTPITTPSAEEIDAALKRVDPPTDDGHEIYFTRLGLTERNDVNTGVLVVDALIDAFELLGTDPPRSDIDAGDDRVDAVFASAVGDAAITSGLEPVDEVAAFELINVTDRFDALETAEPSATAPAADPQPAPGDGISSDEAKSLEVDELLEEFNEFDDLDEMVEDIDDDELDVFDDMGDAGAFDDLLGEDDLSAQGDVDDSPSDAADEPDGAAATEPEPADSPSAAADDDDVDDASAVFAELKDEVEMVGFDELQDELDELEFDEFDSEDEVGMDDLLGEDVDVDDDSFLDETEPIDETGLVDDTEPTEESIDDVLLESDETDSEPHGETAVDIDSEPTPVDTDSVESQPEDGRDEPTTPAAESTPPEADSALDTTASSGEDADADAESAVETETDTPLEGDDTTDVDVTDSLADESADDPFAGDEAFGNYTEYTEPDDEFDDGDDDLDGAFSDDDFDDAFGDGDAFDDAFGDDDFDDAFGDDFASDDAFGEEFDADDTGETSVATFSEGSTASFDDDTETESEDDDVIRRIDEPTFGIPEVTLPDSPDRTDTDDQTDESQSIRVDVDQIDSLLTLVEGLVTTRVRLRDAVTDGEEVAALETELDDLSDLTTELQETVMDVRLVPLESVTNRLPRVVRDIAREQDKAVEFELTGEDVELDRSILDRIGDPLTHLIRNAVDHGIEAPDEREAAGKPRTGIVEVRADRSRDGVTITVEDDGSGLDPDRLRSEAIDADVLTESEAADLSDAEAADLIFHPGLSTTDEVTDISGRGVGMDVVKRTIEDLDGTVSIDSDRGEGTRVTMTLPVTVAIDDVLFLESGDEVFGIPTKSVLDIEPADRLEQVDGRAVLPDDDDAYSVIQLDDALETPHEGDDGDGMLVRIRDDVRPVVLHCDRVRGQQEVVVKPFEGFMGGIPGLSGATVRGRGEVVNILDVTTL